MTLEAAVADYIEQVSGERPEMTPVSSEAVNRLPVYLRRAWDLRRMRLLGRELVLALPRGGPRSGLARLAKDHAALVSGLETEVVVVVPDIRSYERRQLVQKRLPFVAPGRQLFLPMFLADFRETFSPPVQPEAESMSWISQLIVLRHLLIRDVEERPMAEVAEAMGYTAMAVTHGVRQLVALELCTKVPQGRAKTIKFNLEPKALWGRALVRMRSPAGRRYPIVGADGRMTDALEAGFTALSYKTDLAYNGPRIVALPNPEVKELLSDSSLGTRVAEEDADFVVEGWSYNPQLLSRGPAVDELSLYLSLKDDMDERVQMALRDMLERRAW